MKACLCVLALALATCGAEETQAANTVQGVLLNDDDPYFVKGRDGTIYECEWYGGDVAWFKGDSVLLTKSGGFAQMIGLSGPSKENATKVYVEEK